MRSIFGDEKKLSTAALSQTLSDRLMLQTMLLGHQTLDLLAGVLGEHRAFSMLAYVWRRTRDPETGAA